MIRLVLTSAMAPLLVLSGCGAGDTRAQLRDLCDEIGATAREGLAPDDTEAFVNSTGDRLVALEEEATAGQTARLIIEVYEALMASRSIEEFALRSAPSCTEAYDAPRDE